MLGLKYIYNTDQSLKGIHWVVMGRNANGLNTLTILIVYFLFAFSFVRN